MQAEAVTSFADPPDPVRDGIVASRLAWGTTATGGAVPRPADRGGGDTSTACRVARATEALQEPMHDGIRGDIARSLAQWAAASEATEALLRRPPGPSLGGVAMPSPPQPPDPKRPLQEWLDAAANDREGVAQCESQARSEIEAAEALFARVLATTHRARAVARAERAAVYAGGRMQANANACRARFLTEHRRLGLALHTEHIARLARLALTAGAPFADRWAGKLGGEVVAAAVSRAARPPPPLPRWKRVRAHH